jgi:hypothetical protein
VSIYGTGDYATGLTSERAETERQYAQRRTDRFKALEQAQATIMNQLGIISRNGKYPEFMERLKEAEERYAEAYSEILQNAPEGTKAISGRGR